MIHLRKSPRTCLIGTDAAQLLRTPDVTLAIVVHVRSDLGIQWCEMSEWDCTSTAVTGPLIRAQLQLIIQMLGSSKRPDCCGEVMSELNLARDLRNWSWEKTDPNRSGSSGDIAKLFRHEPPKAPGVLAQGAPPAAAVLMARELLQNSWDAAHDLKRTLGEKAPQFAITFRFRELVGDEKKDLVAILGLKAHAARVEQCDKSRLGLPEQTCLHEISDPNRPLRILEVIESGASGMYGPWHQNKSHMYLALVSIGYTEKPSGSGGSYGYGKAGLIASSSIRTVCAYTCFLPTTEEPTTTRRLLGMTYWGQHDLDGTNYTGFARFGHWMDSTGHAVVPFENDRADEVAASLGFAVRSPAYPDELGTSFLIVDPTVEPLELVKAIERNWWPALIENDFAVTVLDYDGASIVPRPRTDPVLKTFIEAWQIAMGRTEADGEKSVVRSLLAKDTSAAQALGTLALTSDLGGWSYADDTRGDDDVPRHYSLVALTRSTRMVIEYHVCGQSAPYVRGVFIADPALNELLRDSEPKGHDAWRKEGDEGLRPEAARVAGEILEKIKSQVSYFRRRLKPPAPKAEEVVLPFYNELMGRIMRGSGKSVAIPEAKVRPVSVSLDYGVESVDESFIRLKGSAEVQLSDNCQVDEADAVIEVAYHFVEDDQLGDSVPVDLVLKGDWSSLGVGRVRARLSKAAPVRIQFASEPYISYWTGRLTVSAELESVADREGSTAL